MVLVAIVGVILIAFLLFFSKESPSTVANNYLVALAKGDVKTLVDLSYYPTKSKEQLTEEYTFATTKAAPYYRFVWKLKHSKETDDQTAAVTTQFIRAADDMQSAEEKVEIPLVKVDGKWKVDVAGLSRIIYPALP